MQIIKNIFYVFLAILAIGLIAGLMAIVTVASGFLTIVAIVIGVIWIVAWIIKSSFESKG